VVEEDDDVGVAAGLAWTPAGGDVLFVEATLMPGKGELKLTGQVGDVMKESAQAAMTYVRSRWSELRLLEDFNQKKDVHIHVPAGAVPKDGPSAGITMATVLASAFTGRPIRNDVAMTGEITLRGKVLPIGGVRDKVLAAHRAGISTVILPEENRKDLDDIPETVRKDLKLVFAKHMDRVIDTALARRSRKLGPNGNASAKKAGSATGRSARQKRSPAANVN
jgi:ATP-dependent Lon protease